MLLMCSCLSRAAPRTQPPSVSPPCDADEGESQHQATGALVQPGIGARMSEVVMLRMGRPPAAEERKAAGLTRRKTLGSCPPPD